MRYARIGCTTLLAGLVLLGWLARTLGCEQPKVAGQAKRPRHESRDAARKAARRELLDDSASLDVLWRDHEIWVTVPDDGTSRLGRAQVYCQVIREHTSDWSRVVVKNEDATRTLGSFDCPLSWGRDVRGVDSTP